MRLYVKSMIEPRSVILPGYNSGEFDELSFVEVLAERSKERVWYFNRRCCHSCGVLNDKFFQRRECRALLIAREINKL